MKDHIFETLSQIIFLLVFTIFAILVSLGISQDFSVLATTEFWVQIASQLVLTMTIFNIVHGMDLRNRMHNEDSRFFKAFATFRLRVKEIDTQKLYDKLDIAVEEKNKERLIKKCNDKLHRLCTRVNYEDVITQEPVDYLINKFKVFEKMEKKFKKLVEKIRTGQIRVVPVKAEVFLQDKEVIFNKDEVYDYSEVAHLLKRNTIKAVTFLVCSIILATITFSLVSPNFWTALVTNFTLFLGATISGFYTASTEIKIKTGLYETRNLFLRKYLDLSIEYSSK